MDTRHETTSEKLTPKKEWTTPGIIDLDTKQTKYDFHGGHWDDTTASGTRMS